MILGRCTVEVRIKKASDVAVFGVTSLVREEGSYWLLGRRKMARGSHCKNVIIATYAHGGGMCVNGRVTEYVSYALGVQIRT